MTSLYELAANLERFSLWLDSRDLQLDAEKVREIARRQTMDTLEAIEREEVRCDA